ncbi:MAG TPA: phosphoribosylformylglycinamidine synthase subunit PurS [Bacteroidetes bacterium]|nr:phosphoribosylformylglycinamidine synthase subunit PurS [Bacteroidota bacterium]
MFTAKVYIQLKSGILDPQGKAVEHALASLGFGQISTARVGKLIELTVDAADQAEAETIVRGACEKLLANPVIEEYRYDIQRAEQEAEA